MNDDKLDMALEDIIMKNSGSVPSRGGSGRPVKFRKQLNAGASKRGAAGRHSGGGAKGIINRRARISMRGAQPALQQGRGATNSSDHKGGAFVKNRRISKRPEQQAPAETNSARGRIHARIARDQQHRQGHSTHAAQQNASRQQNSALNRQRSSPRQQQPIRRQRKQLSHSDNAFAAPSRHSAPNLQIAITNDRARIPPSQAAPTVGRMYADYYGNARGNAHPTMSPYGPPHMQGSLAARFASSPAVIRRL